MVGALLVLKVVFEGVEREKKQLVTISSIEIRQQYAMLKGQCMREIMRSLELKRTCTGQDQKSSLQKTMEKTRAIYPNR